MLSQTDSRTARLARALKSSLRTGLAAGLAVSLSALPAAAFDTKAQAAYVLDAGTDTVLLSKNADVPLPPASMSKLMTLYVAFEALRDGRLTLDEELPVSEHAMSYKGSTMFLDTLDRVRVEDLLRGIIVLSGNDACVVIAEALSPDGTEAGFARYMTKRGQELGMTASTFANSNGWPAAGHRMSVHDLAILAERLIEDFPEYYPLFAETKFEFDGRAPSNVRNRNPLLKLGIGADGLKTGHTEEAGYGLVGSAKQGDRRVIFVVSGLDSERVRAEEAEALVNWSFRQFTKKTVAKEGIPIAEAEIWRGAERSVGLVPAEDLEILLPSLAGGTIEGEVVYSGPIEAPVAKGQRLAELVLQPEELPEVRLPLVAESDVPAGGFVVRVKTAAQVLIKRFLTGPEGAL
ncbi:D-alanyl-D-alanine carboxypeptidase [Leisingera daeponensis]|uniref:serine-type D-Ala-D-Ala carboxypeptidase n=1 Tax=Leisingera daeponensis TaxID=405746 RepID=A0ABS7NGW4_9RHOB|nr:D-alanyl-D-alanine carboxypeptidase family protein [Leisingera daeponensis]MBY6056797.1 D-alanyl-D-alanine carboxypeptidase [Leisingera daeponensis]MBY6139341.1 D-alanyl-D-alanine carboxypeptidase [Leisingera daeponensis]